MRSRQPPWPLDIVAGHKSPLQALRFLLYVFTLPFSLFCTDFSSFISSSSFFYTYTFCARFSTHTLHVFSIHHITPFFTQTYTHTFTLFFHIFVWIVFRVQYFVYICSCFLLNKQWERKPRLNFLCQSYTVKTLEIVTLKGLNTAMTKS